MNPVIEKDLTALLEDAIRQTVRETVLELKKAGLLRESDNHLYKATTQKLAAYFGDIRCQRTGDPAVRDALRGIAMDDYKGIIKLYYADHKTIEQIAEIFDCDPRTITRNKKRLVITVGELLARENL